MNALKHGLTARTVVLSNEDEDEYNALLDAYVLDLAPVGAVELDLVVEMANARWRQRRLSLIESSLLDEQIETQKPKLERIYKLYTPVIEHSFAFTTLVESGPLLSLSRMESRLERAYSRALKNLLQLQRNRKSAAPAAPPPTNDRKKVQNEPNPTTEHNQPPNEKRATRNEQRETRNEQRPDLLN